MKNNISENNTLENVLGFLIGILTIAWSAAFIVAAFSGTWGAAIWLTRWFISLI